MSKGTRAVGCGAGEAAPRLRSIVRLCSSMATTPRVLPGSRIADFQRPVDGVVLGRKAVAMDYRPLDATDLSDVMRARPAHSCPLGVHHRIARKAGSIPTKPTFLPGDAIPTSARGASAPGVRPSTRSRLPGSGATRRAMSARTSCEPGTQFLAGLARLGSRSRQGATDSCLPVPCADPPANPAAAAPTRSRPGCSLRWS